jgi:hypothetical protein
MKNPTKTVGVIFLLLTLISLSSCRSVFYSKVNSRKEVMPNSLHASRQITSYERRYIGKGKKIYDPTIKKYQKIKVWTYDKKGNRKSIQTTKQMLIGNVIMSKEIKGKYYNEKGKRISEQEYWMGMSR